MKEDSKARFLAQGEGGAQGLTAKHKTILAVFGLSFGVTYGVIPRRSLLVPFTPDRREDLNGG